MKEHAIPGKKKKKNSRKAKFFSNGVAFIWNRFMQITVNCFLFDDDVSTFHTRNRYFYRRATLTNIILHLLPIGVYIKKKKRIFPLVNGFKLMNVQKDPCSRKALFTGKQMEN